MKIGFFDSGVGGLLILRAVREHMPEYTYLYYGDTAHVPYGNRSEAEIYELTKQGVAYLFAHDCALVVIACNTASAESLRRLQDEYLEENYPDRRILGVIIPTVEELIESDATSALLIATTRTVESKKYSLELAHRTHTQTNLRACAVPELVPLIEQGKVSKAAKKAIAVIREAGASCDTVVLGCTHYGVLKKALRKHFESKMTIISQDEIIPYKLEEYVNRHSEIKTRLSTTGKCIIHLTDSGEEYMHTYELILGAAVFERG